MITLELSDGTKVQFRRYEALLVLRLERSGWTLQRHIASEMRIHDWIVCDNDTWKMVVQWGVL